MLAPIHDSIDLYKKCYNNYCYCPCSCHCLKHYSICERNVFVIIVNIRNFAKKIILS